MTRRAGIRELVVAAVAAVVTSAGAAAVLLQPPDPLRKITGTNDVAPGLAWSIDAAAMLGQQFAEFRSPVHSTSINLGGPGFIDAGDTLITVVGVSTDESIELRDAVMYGIDAATGETRWHAPAAELSGCAAVPLDGQLVCFTDPLSRSAALVGYDITDGAVTRTPVDWNIFALAVNDGRLFVAEGDVESDDVRVHSGVLADPDSHWSRPFEVGTSWEDMPSDALDVTHGQGLIALGADLAGFDLDTGTPTWTAQLDGCSRVTITEPALVERIHTQCSGYQITGTDVLDRTGQVLATTSHSAAHSLSVDDPADDSIPILLADKAFDRRDGTVRWTNPDLLYTGPANDGGTTQRGTAVAILGEVAILHDPSSDTWSGLDLHTGETLWRNVNDRSGTVSSNDDSPAILSDSTGLWALDVRTGRTLWDIPFRAVNADRDALAGNTALAPTGNGRFVLASARTMLGLRPFD
ncbi:PQQ-binding-like beta-propeller repeat protein [Nocardia sp. NPDC058658]|uniref:outer membrane protein assembly factor BamB family protein n=1 Tax=Nocardia sp. NPDC058658 TaxID=3346580 RepID=UPI00366262BC